MGLTLQAEAVCPGWEAGELGTWTLQSTDAILVAPPRVDDPWAATGCLSDATLGIVGGAVARRSDGGLIELDLGDLRLVGDFPTQGTWDPGCELTTGEQDNGDRPVRDAHCGCAHSQPRQAARLLLPPAILLLWRRSRR